MPVNFPLSSRLALASNCRGEHGSLVSRGSSSGAECGHGSLHLAKYVLDDLGQGVYGGQCHVLSRSSFTEGLVCARAAVLRRPSAVCPFGDALATERCLARCHTLARVPTSSDWSTPRYKALAILVPIREQTSSRGHSGVATGCLGALVTARHFPLSDPDSFSILP